MPGKRNLRPLEGKWVNVRFDRVDDRAYPSDGQLFSLRNVQLDPDDGLWSPAHGAISLTPGYDLADGAISAIHWFQPRKNQRFLLAERRTASTTAAISWLDVRNGGEPTDIATGRRWLESGQPPARFLDFGRHCIITSPLEGPIRWDGEKVSPFGFAGPAPTPTVQGPDQGFDFWDVVANDPTIPFNARNRTKQRGVGEFPADANAPWRYGYRITIIDDMGQESPPSAMVFATGTNTDDEYGRRMVLVHVPNMPGHIRGVRIWRTLNLSDIDEPLATATVYLIAQFPNAYGFKWVDHCPDGELIRALDEDSVGVVPQGCRSFELWAGRGWMIGSPSSPNRLFYSAPGLPGQWPGVNFFDVGSAASGGGTALRATPRGLFVAKSDGLYMVKPQGDSFRLETLVEGVGVSSPASVAVIPDTGVFFVSESGPMLLRGSLDDDQPTQTIRLDQGARKLWARAGQKHLARAVYDPKRREVWVQTIDGGTGFLTLGLVYHLDAGSWSVRDGWSVGGFEFYRDRLWVANGAGRGVHAISAASRVYPDDTDITGYIETIAVEAQETWAPTAMEVLGIAWGSTTFGIESRSDRVPLWSTQSETDRQQHHHMHHPDEWGSGEWDDGSLTKLWGDYEPTRMRVSLDLKEGWSHQLRVSGSTFSFAGLMLEVPPGTFHPRPFEETP